MSAPPSSIRGLNPRVNNTDIHLNSHGTLRELAIVLYFVLQCSETLGDLFAFFRFLRIFLLRDSLVHIIDGASLPINI